MDYTYRELDASDTHLLQKLMVVFAKAFEDTSTYQKAPAGEKYLLDLLSKPHFITLVAIHNNNVVGGLVAYELEKFEQERSEIYIYDLAVDEDHRRKGLATHLIGELRDIAKRRGAYVIYVQADHGDEPAIALYESLGKKEDVYHFDIRVG